MVFTRHGTITDMRGFSIHKPRHRSAPWMVGSRWSDHPHIISKGQRYLTCVVDHDTGRLVWAHEGRNKDTLSKFFQDLGESRSAVLTHVSADGAEWIHAVVRERAPQAVLCLDPFHVVAWVTKALDKVRRRTLDQAGGGDRNDRWAVIKNPRDLTPEQRGSLARIKTTNTALYRAYLLKEQLR